jgi:hypothetical protein
MAGLSLSSILRLAVVFHLLNRAKPIKPESTSQTAAEIVSVLMSLKPAATCFMTFYILLLSFIQQYDLSGITCLGEIKTSNHHPFGLNGSLVSGTNSTLIRISKKTHPSCNRNYGCYYSPNEIV